MTSDQKLQGKKILYLITQTKWGGAQKYVLELAQYFAQNNEVHIAYGETNDLNEKFIQIAQQHQIKTIPIAKLVRAIDLSKDLLVVPAIVKLLNQESYHLIHLNSSKAGLLGSLASQLYNLNPLNTKLRVVYTAHGFVFNEPLNPTIKKLYKLSETFSTGLQNIVIAVSKYDKASAIESKICPPDKIFVVPNGIKETDYNFLAKDEAQKKLQLDKSKKYFGTLASFYLTKGHHYLIEAIKLLKEKNSPLLKSYQWILIGSGPEQVKIQKQIDDHHLTDYIKIVPGDAQDWQYLKAFDYFVLPSVKEGLPYTLLEAGLAKIPTIASSVGGVPEIINHDQGLLVAAANPLALAEAMETMSLHQAKADELANNNYENIRTNFSLDKTLNKTEEIYLKLF